MYIGQTTLCVEDRYKQHTKPSVHKKQYKIYKAIKKHGVENFYYEILEEGIDIEHLNEKEVYYIEKYNSYKEGYNSTKGGDGRHLNKIEDIEYVINELKSGRMVGDIAEELDVCNATIDRTLKSVGIKKASLIQGKKNTKHLQKINREDVKNMYEEGCSYKKISKILNIDCRSISRIVNELGLERRKKRVNYNDLDTESIFHDLKSMSKKDLDEKYELNQHSLNIIKKTKRKT